MNVLLVKLNIEVKLKIDSRWRHLIMSNFKPLEQNTLR